MKCPHCLTSFHSNPDTSRLGSDEDGTWNVSYELCPECNRLIVKLVLLRSNYHPAYILVRPKGFSRSPLPSEVDDIQVVEDYSEAALVLNDSPKASAALSRRCLQHILREKGGVTKSDLSSEIIEIISSGNLPSVIAENLDAIRNIGNFAAHPIKCTSTGEIVDVEPNEAEWNLEVLEQLVDFYYVRPAIAKKKRDDLNEKLASAGKPPIR